MYGQQNIKTTEMSNLKNFDPHFDNRIYISIIDM